MRLAFGFVIASLLMIGSAAAQERQFSVTLTEAQWNMIGKLLSEKNDLAWKDTNPIIQAITGQIGQVLQQDAQARQGAAAEIDRLKAEIERLKKPPEPENP